MIPVLQILRKLAQIGSKIFASTANTMKGDEPGTEPGTEPPKEGGDEMSEKVAEVLRVLKEKGSS